MKERIRLDFYETPPWQTLALRRRVQIAGSVLECCVGDGSLADILADCEIVTNDIDKERVADFHLDATCTQSWSSFPKTDWVVTNPPFSAAMPILQAAVNHARVGIAFLLRLSFLEPTKLRSQWLNEHPPSRQIILPRWSYTQNGSTDSMTTAWCIWTKSRLPIEIVPITEKEDLIRFSTNYND